MPERHCTRAPCPLDCSPPGCCNCWWTFLSRSFPLPSTLAAVCCAFGIFIFVSYVRPTTTKRLPARTACCQDHLCRAGFSCQNGSRFACRGGAALYFEIWSHLSFHFLPLSYVSSHPPREVELCKFLLPHTDFLMYVIIHYQRIRYL